MLTGPANPFCKDGARLSIQALIEKFIVCQLSADYKQMLICMQS